VRPGAQFQPDGRSGRVSGPAPENRIRAADPDWPGWSAAYLPAERAGTELPR
jgi:hypothetical protein